MISLFGSGVHRYISYLVTIKTILKMTDNIFSSVFASMLFLLLWATSAAAIT